MTRVEKRQDCACYMIVQNGLCLTANSWSAFDESTELLWIGGLDLETPGDGSACTPKVVN